MESDQRDDFDGAVSPEQVRLMIEASMVQLIAEPVLPAS